MGDFRQFFRRVFRRRIPSPGLVALAGSRFEANIRLTESSLDGRQAVITASPSNEESTTTPLSLPRHPQSVPSAGNSMPQTRGSVPDSPQNLMADDSAQGPSDPQRQGLFQNASNFSINQPIMGEHIEINQHNTNVFEIMRLNHVIRGAEFDSSDRDYPPRCHPGTRTRFLEKLQSHIRSGTRIIWIRGPAGVGKSAIMQTLAETISPDFTCSTLFFSRPNKRDDPKKVFSTLAYAFVVANSSYRQYLGGKLAIDSGFLDRSIEEQFKRLFIIPFTDNHIDAGSLPWVVFLDGLDECNGKPEQSRIVDVIRESILRRENSMPFVWVIASRPEVHLNAPFGQIEAEVGNFWKLEIPIDSDEASLDAERYLRAEFAKIRRNYSDMIPSYWPSESDFLKLTKTCSGLFVFAKTSVVYIGEDDPVLRFEHILSLITQHNAEFGSEYAVPTKNPFEMLDLLYRTILSDVPTEFLATTKTILSFGLHNHAVHTSMTSPASRPGLIEICNILGIKQHMAYAALRGLNSVLSFPPQETPEGTIKFLHASFSDFLKDPSRSQCYHVDLNLELEKIWRCYVRIAKQSVNSLDDVALSWQCETAEGNNKLRRQILKRAERKWLDILLDCCYINCASGLSESETARHHRISPSISELTQIFQDIFPILFRPQHHKVVFLRGWLWSYAPPELRQTILLKEFDLTQFDESEADKMFDGLCTQDWGYYLDVDINSISAPLELDLTGLSCSQWNEIKGGAELNAKGSARKERPLDWTILGCLLKRQHPFGGHRSILITIIGTDASGYFAFIGPSDDAKMAPKGLYLMIPYSPGQHERRI